MTTLEIRDLRASVAGKPDPERHRPDGVVGRGARRDGPERRRQVDAVGGRDGPARLRGARRHGHARRADVLAMPNRGSGPIAGLHLVMQYPTEVPGVRVDAALAEAFASPRARRHAPRGRDAVGSGPHRARQRPAASASLNVDLSGGEKKRHETLQLAVLHPQIAILDELDSGLDIDALRDCARRIEAPHQRRPRRAGHHALRRLLQELRPDFVHILARGRIVASGGPELADELERDGYGAFAPEEAAATPKPCSTRSPTPSPDRTATARPSPVHVRICAGFRHFS